MLTSEYTFEYGTFKVRLSAKRTDRGLLTWTANNRKPNTFDLWELYIAWEMNTPDGVLVVIDETAL